MTITTGPVGAREAAELELAASKQAAERSTAGDPVGNGGNARSPMTSGGMNRASDQQNLTGDLRQLSDLTIEDRFTVHNERAFVLAAEPGRTSAREDRPGQHSAILSH